MINFYLGINTICSNYSLEIIVTNQIDFITKGFIDVCQFLY